MFMLVVYLFWVDGIELPGRYDSSALILEAPALYLVAMLPLSFSVALILSVIDREKYTRLCKGIVSIGMILLFIGLVVVSPILKLIKLF